MLETEPVYIVQITEALSGRTLVNTIHEGKLMPLLKEDGVFGAKVLAADSRRYWRARDAAEAQVEHA